MLRILLRRELSKLHAFETVTFEWDQAERGAPGPRVLRLEGMVTRFKMGSGFLRYLSGLIPFLTTGATDLQVAARLTNARTGDVVLEFVDRRRGMYNTPWGANPKNLRDGFAMSHTVLDTARCLATLIGKFHSELSTSQVAALDDPDY
jgi:hypothetical protein